MKCTPLGTKGATSLTTAPLTEPTSDRMAPWLQMRRDRRRHLLVSCRPARRGSPDRRPSPPSAALSAMACAEPSSARALPHRVARVIPGNRFRQLPALDRMGDGGADQAQSDHGDLADHQRRHELAQGRDHALFGLVGAHGQAQRSPAGRSRPRRAGSDPRWLRKASALAALFSPLRKMDQDEIGYAVIHASGPACGSPR